MSLMKKHMTLIASILVSNIFTRVSVIGKITIQPIDTEVLLGQSTFFNCSSTIKDKTITWYFYPVGGSGLDRKYIYAFGKLFNPYVDRVGIDVSESGVCNLVIFSATAQDAGRYDCQDDGGIGETQSGQLVVIDGKPTCHSSESLDELIGPNDCGIEPDEVQLSCTVTYSGNIPPVMEWKAIKGNEIVIGQVSSVKEGNSVTYHLASKIDLFMAGSVYLCQTTRTSGTSQLPKPRCTSDILHILYAFSLNLTVNASVGDTVVCAANANVDCDYKWKWFRGDDMTTESASATLIPTKQGSHKCEATCVIKNHSCTIQSMTAMVSVNSNSGTILGTVITVVIVVLVVVAVSVVLYVRKQKTKNILLKSEAIPTKRIRGLAILERELFVLFLQNPKIKIYDSTTYRPRRNIIVNGMGHPANLASCPINKCLYVPDWYFKDKERGPQILRINPSDGAILNMWETGGGGGEISVASDSNIILNVEMILCLREYTAYGECVRVINVASGTNIINSIKLRSGLFVVSHGGVEDPLYRVCLLRVKELKENQNEYDTEVVEVYDGEEDSIIGSPALLAIDDEETILVSDCENNQIILLDSSLKNPEHLVTEELDSPYRVCAHNSRKGWLIADGLRVFLYIFEGNAMLNTEVKLDFSP